jgi:hypothetical protein
MSRRVASARSLSPADTGAALERRPVPKTCPQGIAGPPSSRARSPNCACSSGFQEQRPSCRLATPSRLGRCSMERAQQADLQALFEGVASSIALPMVMRRCSAVLGEATKIPDFRGSFLCRSPLTDSNRRPPPYHAVPAATGRNPRQRFWRSFAVSGGVPFAAVCHRLRPLCSINAPSFVVCCGYADPSKTHFFSGAGSRCRGDGDTHAQRVARRR